MDVTRSQSDGRVDMMNVLNPRQNNLSDEADDNNNLEFRSKAKIWTLYLEDAEQTAKEKVDTWRTSLDSLLIFASLFDISSRTINSIGFSGRFIRWGSLRFHYRRPERPSIRLRAEFIERHLGRFAPAPGSYGGRSGPGLGQMDLHSMAPQPPAYSFLRCHGCPSQRLAGAISSYSFKR